jgi:hypothetical protein
MRLLYCGDRVDLEFEFASAQICTRERISGLVMTSGAVTSQSNNVRARAHRLLAQIRDWPAEGNSPYSPVYCVSLLLAVGLIIGIGR